MIIFKFVGVRYLTLVSTTLLVAILCSIAPLRAEPFNAHDPLLIWADAVFEDKYYRSAPLTAHGRANITVVDYFGNEPIFERKGRNLWKNGQEIPTAGKGSTWVYDSVHRIASGTGCCEYTHDFLIYSKAPPRMLPSRDLSSVRTHRGLHLGMTIPEAAAALGIPISTIHRTGKMYESLEFFKRDPKRTGGFIGAVYFKKGRAVGIDIGMADS